MKLTILGSSSAIPTKERNLSAQLLEIAGHSLLLDCGEATQFQLQRFDKKTSQIRYVLISHLHGDHYFGLVGLLSTMHMLGREKDLHIYSPKGLKEIIYLQFGESKTKLNYNLVFHIIETDNKTMLFEEEAYQVFTFPLKHSTETYGFLIQEKSGERTIKKEFVNEHEIPYKWFPRIKAGEDYIDENGNIFLNKDITTAPENPSSFAYMSDTAFLPERAADIRGVDVLYHEATFLEEDIEKAILRTHSTAAQAAEIAHQALVGKLIIGHFSTRYKDVDAFLTEAKQKFDNVVLAEDGMFIEIL